MDGDGAYGRHLGEALKVSTARGFVSRARLGVSEIAVIQIVSNEADNAMTSPLPPEDAFLATVQMRDWPKRILWADGRSVDAKPLQAGALSIFDLRRRWAGLRVCPIHQISFHLPRKSLDRIAEEEGLPAIDAFVNDPCEGGEDVTLYALAKSLLLAFERPDEANRLFVDHVTLAAAAQMATRHTHRQNRANSQQRLDVRQVRRATEAVAAHLDGDVAVSDLAFDAAMPVAQFSIAFRRTFGVAPPGYLLLRRIDRAKELLRRTHTPVAEIAAECGFASERHFARVFKRATGALPRQWRATIRN